MKRKIKFPLIMKDGVEVRNIDELRENFELRRIIDYYFGGKLKIWLKDRNYEEELKKIANLDIESSKFNEDLCKSLGVNYEAPNNEDSEWIEELKEFNKIYFRLKGKYIDFESIEAFMLPALKDAFSKFSEFIKYHKIHLK